MAYLSTCGYKNDVFVSYAYADNAPMLDSKIMWVSNFIDDLQKELTMKLGKKEGIEPSICLDGDIPKNILISDSLTQEIDRSAIHLIIMSPAYLASHWCEHERLHYYKIAKRNGYTSRLFVVEIDEIDSKAYPPEIHKHLLAYRFWKKEGYMVKRVGFPSRLDEDYCNQLLKITKDLEKELITIKSNEGANQSNEGSINPPASPPSKTVFLAQVTDDLEDKREAVKEFLKAEGYNVIPEQNWYFNYEEKTLKSNISENLRLSSVYVQLASEFSGRKLAFENNTIATLQFEMAKGELMECPNDKIMIWRSPALNIDQVQNQPLKQILESEYTRNEVFEDFKMALLQNLKQPGPPPDNPSHFVYICTDIVDKPYCESNIARMLEQKQIDYVYSLCECKEASEVRKFHEQNLLDCDAVVFIYCSSDPKIVLSQILQCRKIRPNREKPFLVTAIYDGPPPEKAKIELMIHGINFSYLNCRENLNDFIEKFLNIVSKNGNSSRN